MRSEATGPGVQHEGFDVDEKIPGIDARSNRSNLCIGIDAQSN